jgi:hypothetical protein
MKPTYQLCCSCVRPVLSPNLMGPSVLSMKYLHLIVEGWPSFCIFLLPVDNLVHRLLSTYAVRMRTAPACHVASPGL